jgi:RNA polymerase sigma factor (sigma-70 family)
MDKSVFFEWRRTGSLRLRDKLVLDNMRIVHNIVHRFAKGSDYEDLAQEGAIGLIEALHNYQPDKGGFYSYAKWKVLYRIQECIRLKKGVSTSRNKLTKNDAADCLYGPLDGSRRDNSQTEVGAERAEARRTVRRVVRDLHPRELEALIAAWEGATPKELGELLRCDPRKALELVDALREQATEIVDVAEDLYCWKCKGDEHSCPHA